MRRINIVMKYYNNWDDWRYDVEVWFYDTFIVPVKKIYRYSKRLIRWIPFLWNNENWDFNYLIDVIEFKLQELEEAQRTDDLHVGSDKRAREIRIVIEHIKRYKDIDKYTLDNDTDEFLNNTYWEEIENSEGRSYGRMKHRDENLHKKHMRIVEHQSVLEDWHFKEIFKKLSRKGRNWWT